MHALILADGAFPASENRLNLLKHSEVIVCCDGAAAKLEAFGREPFAIVGDLDSVPEMLKEKYSDRLHPVTEQETNDLTKAVEFCLSKGFDELAILGATGLREDHTLGNIALLAEYVPRVASICLLTDYGRFDAIRCGLTQEQYNRSMGDKKAPEVSPTRNGEFTVARFESTKGQQVSIFALDPDSRLSSLGLAYPLENRKLTSWWQGTLNECTGEQFSLSVDKGSLIVYRLDPR